MHVRFSTALGMPVVDSDSDEDLGSISGILIHPDTGKVEGFFVGRGRWFRSQDLFLASHDIAHWGLAARIRDADCLSPLEDRIRLASIVEDGRAVLGQAMVTEAGSVIGECRDVQFETKTFMVEWFFPKKWWRWGPAVPFSAIVEIRPDAIVVRDPLVPQRVGKRSKVLTTLDKLTEPPSPVPPPLEG
jgi:uncharacterized protein YrrD